MRLVSSQLLLPLQAMTTNDTGAGTYGLYAACFVKGQFVPQTVAIDVSDSHYNATIEQRTITVNNLNLVISADSTKGLKLVFDLSNAIIFGVSSGEPLHICVLPGAPSITAASGEVE